MRIEQEIQTLKAERDAVILAHNYQPGEIQDIADFTGDSLELAREATHIRARVVVFCGVHFMAETAAILNPDKTVLLPAADAGCPMADMITGEQLRAMKARHPDARVLCYVNSTAEVKAESDCCVTSANAVAVARSFPPQQPLLFVPDRHLGSYTAEQTGHDLILWPGFCPTHARLTEAHIATARAAYPGAPVLVHPECPKPVRDAADAVLSTGGMCQWVKERAEPVFLIGTETGILHRLRRENPDKTFIPLLEQAVCPYMKKTSVEHVLRSLRDLQTVITVPEPIAQRARRAIDAMLAIH
ncbi:MAG TPA: quinolinate synthase NadA [Kiritimatiellia bacterium]|jgi:quinolinate synthase|nr:quinolinate synthase NadA [Kiritimatiellia bacterium]HOR97940.1 quinolinate synthase NadA [Kiritimatiellia bacterium]HPC49506.1 quinolinate synthase NadA [Kiritimatiellia bacterium]HPK37696.1 quinolinate synthase NadA [Kiritimatiellia bacterium]HPW75232.1 quinolinate synthase NadA [Kiritimatiellia bacterium]